MTPRMVRIERAVLRRSAATATAMTGTRELDPGVLTLRHWFARSFVFACVQQDGRDDDVPDRPRKLVSGLLQGEQSGTGNLVRQGDGMPVGKEGILGAVNHKRRGVDTLESLPPAGTAAEQEVVVMLEARLRLRSKSRPPRSCQAVSSKGRALPANGRALSA